jgi:mono/diheme cytochrome c family protein
MIKRILILLVVVATVSGILLIFSYDVVKIDWIGFMEIQPSYKPMEQPLPVAAKSIPVEGAAFVEGMGAPSNLIEADDVSVARGAELYSLNCTICHGEQGKGDGVVGAALANPPADLTSDRVKGLSDGAIFLTISNGVVVKDQRRMPALNENLSVRERWDLVNYIRKTIQAQP